MVYREWINGCEKSETDAYPGRHPSTIKEYFRESEETVEYQKPHLNFPISPPPSDRTRGLPSCHVSFWEQFPVNGVTCLEQATLHRTSRIFPGVKSLIRVRFLNGLCSDAKVIRTDSFLFTSKLFTSDFGRHHFWQWALQMCNISTTYPANSNLSKLL